MVSLTSSLPPGVPGPPEPPGGLVGGRGLGTGGDGPTGLILVPVEPPPAATSVPPLPFGLSPVAPPLPPSPPLGLLGPPGVPGSGFPTFSLGTLVVEVVSLTSFPPVPAFSGSTLPVPGGGPFTARGEKEEILSYCKTSNKLTPSNKPRSNKLSPQGVQVHQMVNFSEIYINSLCW